MIDFQMNDLRFLRINIRKKYMMLNYCDLYLKLLKNVK